MNTTLTSFLYFALDVLVSTDVIYMISDGVKVIKDNVFFGNTHLTEINLPDSVKVIKERAFTKCRSLKQVRLPNKLRYIGVNTFKKVAEDCEIVYN